MITYKITCYRCGKKWEENPKDYARKHRKLDIYEMMVESAGLDLCPECMEKLRDFFDMKDEKSEDPDKTSTIDAAYGYYVAKNATMEELIRLGDVNRYIAKGYRVTPLSEYLVKNLLLIKKGDKE